MGEMPGHLGKNEEIGVARCPLEGGAQSQPSVAVVRGEPSLCPKTKKSLDLEISSPGLNKYPFSNWGSHQSPSNVALGTQIGLPNTRQDPPSADSTAGGLIPWKSLHPHRLQGRCLLHICFPFIKPGAAAEERAREK